MNKNSKKNFSKVLVKASLWGLAVFAVFGTALYAYAVTYPPTAPGPVSGVVGLYVGKTAGTFDGNVGDYAAANNLCATVDVNSHICAPMEMINTYNHSPGSITAESGVVWVNSGAPANTTPAINDCNGWSDNSLAYYGNVWSFDTDYSGILPCMVTLPIACCK